MFHSLSEVYLEMNCLVTFTIITDHLTKLQDRLESYFQHDLRENKWIRRPFTVMSEDHFNQNQLSLEEKSSLYNIVICDGSIKCIIENVNCLDYGCMRYNFFRQGLDV